MDQVREAYDKLLGKWNKQEKRVVCECGKTTTINRLDAHKKTMYHHQLLSYKKQLGNFSE
jgi:hypothetical protein